MRRYRRELPMIATESPILSSPVLLSMKSSARFAFAGLLAGVAFLCASQARAATVSTATGTGADRGVSECNYTTSSTNNLDVSSSGSDTQLNARWVNGATTFINEVIALRFDLSGNSLAACTNFQIQLVNHRTNSARVLHYYGVIDGSGGCNNNGVVTNWTDDDWAEASSTSVMKFSTMPGLHYDGTPATKGFTNTVDLGSATMNSINEGTVVTFSSAALDNFIRGHPDSLVTILVGVDTSSTGQSRFASKEATSTATGLLTGAAGDFAPRLTFTTENTPVLAGVYFQQQPSDAAAGAVISPSITVVATNSLGSPETNVTVTISLLSGSGSINGTLAQVTDASGVATFTNLSLTATGVKQLSASAGSFTASSAAFAILSGPAASLSFTTEPGSVRVNQPITPPVVVQLRDAYGNNVSSNGAAITVAMTSGTGAMNGTSVVATGPDGSSAFTNLTFDATGIKVLTASHTGLTSAVSTSFLVTNQVPAFPGAEGAGAFATGGRGGDVYYVTSLADANTAGTLRYGINNAPAGGRTILFKVAGNIVLNSTLTINRPRITIAGQTAPGDGVCLQNYSFNIAANDVIVRHVRTRLGTNALQESDAMWINSGTNIMVDHLSASWSVDETLSASRTVANLTVQNCFITESLKNSIHVKGPHGYGGIISSENNATYTYHHNLYAHHSSRNPRVGSDVSNAVVRIDFRNNVVYNWGFYAGYSGDATENVELNYVGNYFVAGPSSSQSAAFVGGATTTRIYQSGNLIDNDKDLLVDGVNTGWSMFTGTYGQTNQPFSVPEITGESAGTAYQRVLASAGAMPWRRDAYDQRMARSVHRRNGQHIDFVNGATFVGDYITNNINGTNFIGVNPWPVLSSSAAPLDTDNDGMPNFWETALGLATNNASDRNITNAIGYTRLEEYLNWLAEPHAVCDRNGFVDVDLRAANGGATNLAFSVANGSNGTVTLLADGFTARFIAANNFSGLAAFAYTATDPANGLSFGPNSFGVLVSITNAPNTPPSLEPVGDHTLSAGSILSFTNRAADTDIPAQSLTFSLLNHPTNASVSAAGVFIWRPLIAQAGTTNTMKVVVTDSGSPSLSATQAFNVVVNLPAAPVLQSAGTSNSQFSFLISGDAGPDYIVQASTNLLNWADLTNFVSPALPFAWADTNTAGFNQRFYRLRLGP